MQRKFAILILAAVAMMVVAMPVNAFGVSGSIWKVTMQPGGSYTAPMGLFLTKYDQPVVNLTVKMQEATGYAMTGSAREWITTDKQSLTLKKPDNLIFEGGRMERVTGTFRVPAGTPPGIYRADINYGVDCSAGSFICWGINVPVVITVP